MRRAWFCWVPKFGGDLERGRVGVYHAESRFQARYECLLNAREAFGRRSVAFVDVRVKRAAAFDGATNRNGVMPQYVERVGLTIDGGAGAKGNAEPTG